MNLSQILSDAQKLSMLLENNILKSQDMVS